MKLTAIAIWGSVFLFLALILLVGLVFMWWMSDYLDREYVDPATDTSSLEDDEEV